jgi:hypothetical protein
MYAARISIAAAALIAGCGGGGDGGAGGDYMAATIDGQQWRATGAASELTTATGVTSLTILGFTPLQPGSKQADETRPEIDIVFDGMVPHAGRYDIPTFPGERHRRIVSRADRLRRDAVASRRIRLGDGAPPACMPRSRRDASA